MADPYLEDVERCLFAEIPYHNIAASIGVPQEVVNATIINGLSKGWWRLEYIPLRSRTDETIETG